MRADVSGEGGVGGVGCLGPQGPASVELSQPGLVPREPVGEKAASVCSGPQPRPSLQEAQEGLSLLLGMGWGLQAEGFLGMRRSPGPGTHPGLVTLPPESNKAPGQDRPQTWGRVAGEGQHQGQNLVPRGPDRHVSCIPEKQPSQGCSGARLGS